MIRYITIAVLITGLTMPLAHAQQVQEDQPGTLKEGLQGLFEKYGPHLEDMARQMQEEGLKELFEGLEPAMEEMLKEMGPALDQARRMLEPFRAMDDPRHYQMPKVLPNGDIIIRRRDDAPPYVAPEEPDAAPEEDDTIKT